jgi:hypothetical protein
MVSYYETNLGGFETSPWESPRAQQLYIIISEISRAK